MWLSSELGIPHWDEQTLQNLKKEQQMHSMHTPETSLNPTLPLPLLRKVKAYLKHGDIQSHNSHSMNCVMYKIYKSNYTFLSLLQEFPVHVHAGACQEGPDARRICTVGWGLSPMYMYSLVPRFIISGFYVTCSTKIGEKAWDEWPLQFLYCKRHKNLGW